MQKRATFCDYHRKSDTYDGAGPARILLAAKPCQLKAYFNIAK
jgi:hypothetical protein